MDSFEHAELIAMITEANPAQVHELGQMWDALGKEVMAFSAILERTAIDSESIWRGQAASAARARLAELVTWCQSTGEGMRDMGTTVLPVQAEAVQTAQRSMPAPVPYDPGAYQNRLNSTSNPSEWAQIQHDAHEQAARHEAARAEAVRVVNTYIAALRSTNGTMPAFTPPPEFGTRETGPRPGVPAPGSGDSTTNNNGHKGIGGKADGGGGAAGVPGAGVHGAGATHRSPQTPPGVAALGGSSVPVGGSPSGGGHSPGSVPPASTPGQLVSSPVPDLGHSVPAGDGGTGVPSFPPAAAGIGGDGGTRRRPSVAGGSGFGPRGSGALNSLGARNTLGHGAAAVTGAGDDIPGIARRGPGGSLEAGGMFPPMLGGGPGRGSEPTEHRRPSYLIETEDIWGDGRPVAPPVIGEDPPESSP
ncbi:MAG: hypothetical protein JO115_18870 [Pseudonocardiales bacterium]|nr:hypothetical protein [Pseudonocardiales bacterium]